MASQLQLLRYGERGQVCSDVVARGCQNGSLGTIHKGRPQNFRDFGPPPPLVRILARSMRVNPRNLPYYVCFWATPSPLPVRTSFMYGPLTLFQRLFLPGYVKVYSHGVNLLVELF